MNTQKRLPANGGNSSKCRDLVTTALLLPITAEYINGNDRGCSAIPAAPSDQAGSENLAANGNTNTNSGRKRKAYEICAQCREEHRVDENRDGMHNCVYHLGN